MEMIEQGSHVRLSVGGLLSYVDPYLAETDVSELAIEYLCERVVLDDGVTLRDILLLLKNNPPLLQVLRRFWAVELIQEALAEEPDSGSGVDDPDEVEYLLLARNCSVDMSTKAYEPMTRLFMSGVGFPQGEPASNGRSVGDRQEWCMLGVPVQACLHYPLRLERTSKVFVYDRAPKEAAGQAISMEEINFGPPTLIQVLHSVAYELSFFGVGERQSELLEALKNAEFSEESMADSDEPFQA
ncbi:MAG: hypothetical protein AW10_00965 [Candidatus Accumulibacter appositus]|uniref:Uncharacterized protein n=1 Tax=Candidatus Accumulibacter appositus TaxID=1454003 RepID=A0A011QSE2_9PROT|nr:hypothetical protein [Accumulibacter sp.]EXI81779.1 MAG: hypothetical protein AW10_00965 [Candidatus Accumulibacter appositus]HRF04154.1 hypothetical protein [Accumulibacter sp.]